MISQINEQALKANTLTYNSLANMVTTIINKLESRTIVSKPKQTVNNEDIHGNVPKSMQENQIQSRPARIGTSITLPMDVVDVTNNHSKDVAHLTIWSAKNTMGTWEMLE